MKYVECFNFEDAHPKEKQEMLRILEPPPLIIDASLSEVYFRTQKQEPSSLLSQHTLSKQLPKIFQRSKYLPKSERTVLTFSQEPM